CQQPPERPAPALPLSGSVSIPLVEQFRAHGTPNDSRRTKYRTQAEYFSIFANNPLQFEPGARWSYSNEGFVVLGAVIEKISGQNYLDYVREHIFLPADMRDTDNYALDEVVPNRAVGYLRYAEDDPLGLAPPERYVRIYGVARQWVRRLLF